jgi:PAB-dependent poly(A)-specific ribonuclease subunit 3
MDHQVYYRFTQTNGVPQESKLANYMNIQNSSPNNLHQTFQSKLNIESSITPKKTLSNPQCIGGASLVSSAPASPNIFNSFTPTLDATPIRCVSSGIEHTDNSTSQSTSPNRVNSCSPMSHDVSGNNIALAAYQENVGGTTYFYPTTSETCHATDVVINSNVTSDYNVYPGTPNHIASLKSKQDSSFFISKDLQMEMMNRNVLTLMQNNQQYADLPQVDSYHELCPLERIPSNSLHKTHLGYQASMYKAIHVKSGTAYCLRRLHGFRLQNAKCMVIVDLWKNLNHSNIVQLQEVFTTKAFGDNSMIFVYDYYPGSETLLSKYFSSDQPDPFAPDTSPRPYSHQKNNILRHQQNNKLPEFLIWNYIIQLTSALRLIHSSGLACRSLDPTKIIITSKNRLRLSCLGVMDVVLNENSASVNPLALVQHYQQEDLTALGKLVLALACKSTVAVQRENITTAVDIISRSYTTDLRNLIMYLLSPQQRKSITDLMPMIGARFYTQMDNLHNYIEVLEYEVSKEIENGRLFRLMAKLGTINERPELNLDGAWAETGDRYMLKLFRDYVFHQVTEDGRPWVDMAHIVQCLNKLDAGVPEKVKMFFNFYNNFNVRYNVNVQNCLYSQKFASQ